MKPLIYLYRKFWSLIRTLLLWSFLFALGGATGGFYGFKIGFKAADETRTIRTTMNALDAVAEMEEVGIIEQIKEYLK